MLIPFLSSCVLIVHHQLANVKRDFCSYITSFGISECEYNKIELYDCSIVMTLNYLLYLQPSSRAGESHHCVILVQFHFQQRVSSNITT